MPAAPLVLGIDVGTGGVRAIFCELAGHVVAMASVPLGEIPAQDAVMPTDGAPATVPWREQSPDAWWSAACLAIRQAVEQVRQRTGAPLELLGATVDGTSGTLVALDSTGSPTRPAIMYNDARSGAEAAELMRAAGDHCARLGYRFDASFALAKILWIARREPKVFLRTTRFVHQSDYIVGRLTGDFSTTDYSNALKTGYDLLDERWPAWLSQFDGITGRLPRVVAPATSIGEITASAAEATGLPRGARIFAGATDGVAGCLASGLRDAGDYNTTLGTTLVFKGLSSRIVRHPDGLIYSHKLPGGAWLPGAASNVGAAWIANWFAGQDPRELDRAAAQHLPGRTIAYPLVGRGERFPLLAPQATGFFLPEPTEPAERFAACLVGVALVERLAYQTLDQACGATSAARGESGFAGGATGGAVYATGGGSRSDVWMQCRADATGRNFHRPATPESAFGSAILAAAGAHYGDLAEAVRGMVRIERTFEPNPAFAAQYDELYGRFIAELRQRGYLSGG